MHNTEKRNVHSSDARSLLLYRLYAGVIAIVESRKKQIATGIVAVAVLLIWIYRYPLFADSSSRMSDDFLMLTSSIKAGIISVIIIGGFLIGIGRPIRAYQYYRSFLRIGFTNAIGMPPILIVCQEYQDCHHIFLRFVSKGIPLESWQSHKDKIENALNITIQDMYIAGNNIYSIEIIGYRGNFEFPQKLEWNRSYLSYDSDILVLGESISDQLSISLSKHAHILIGGATGSGKSVLLKLLLMQCIQHHDYDVFIVDFKGGIDYYPYWIQRCNVVSTYDDLISTLLMINGELEDRMALFYSAGVNNINMYNEISDIPLSRYVIAFDEVAEALDKTGICKEQKERIQEIEHLLSSIARLGRAVGIHLFLATQRPDANVLSGQIKSNITYRICGRADNVLSQIILDSAVANEKVPKDSQGIFINQDGDIFKSYIFDEAVELK